MHPSTIARPDRRDHSPRPSARLHDRAVRRGRVLVECCVSMVLLSAGSAIVLTVSANTAHLVDASRQHDLLQRVTASRVAALVASPCLGVDSRAVEMITPRVVLGLVASAEGPVRTVSVDARWQTSTFAGAVWRRSVTSVSGWCE